MERMTLTKRITLKIAGFVIAAAMICFYDHSHYFIFYNLGDRMIERTAKEAMEVIKDIISPHLGDRKIFTKDVSAALGIPYNTYVTSLNRNSIPYRDILIWCSRTGTDPQKIFFKKGKKWKKNH